jgi:hypothetical protein
MSYKITLKPINSKPCPNEPILKADSSVRDGIRKMVRSCLKANRDITTVISRVQICYGNKSDIIALTEHFYRHEVD